MKALLFAAACIAGVSAAPAFANEGRIEARGGVLQQGGSGVGIAGVAVGYDFDVGQQVFLGGEVSADKLLNSSNDAMIGLTARAGVKLGASGKLFVTGGGTFRTVEDAPYHFGAGYEHKLGKSLYLKAEYRHLTADRFGETADSGTIGLGLKF